MMQRALLPLAALCLLVPNATAALSPAVEPGLVGPAHPLYGVDLVVDNVLKPPGEAVHERPSEAFVAAEANNTAGMNRALRELEAVANRTNGLESAGGLAKAEQVLLDLRDRIPAQATFGSDMALEAVTQAKDRYPTDQLPANGQELPAQRP